MIQTRALFKLLSIFCLLFACTLTLPALVALGHHEPSTPYWTSALYIGVPSLMLAFHLRSTQDTLHRLDGFLLVVATWVTLCVCASLPFFFVLHDAPIMDVLFEAVSGLTTTGAEAFQDVETWSHALQFYHQYLQFLGGLGIIVLGLAIMPLLSQTGHALFAADVPGPTKNQKFTPRLQEMAKLLWRLYVGLTVACAVGYHLAGLSWFEACCYAFSTISTGGFGIHANNIGHYHQNAVLWLATVFMLCGSMNFGLHVLVIRQRSFKPLRHQPELNMFLKWILATFVLCWLNTLVHHASSFDFSGLSIGLMTAVAMVSTTGLQATHFGTWPTFSPILLMLVAMVGGCSGSTSGGIKMARWMVIQKEVACLIKQTLHPRAVVSVFQESLAVSEKMVVAIRGFLCLTLVLYVILLLAFMATGYDFETAFAAITACLSNVGVSIGTLMHGYHHLNAHAKALLIVTMLLGRLEITTLIVLMTPKYWQDHT